MLHAHRKSHVLTIIVLLLMLTLLLPPFGAPDVKAQSSPGFIRHVRTIDTDATDNSRPVGLAFARTSNSLFVAEAGQAGATDTGITRLNSYGRKLTRARVAEALSDPINITYDDRFGRLLLLSPAANRLVTIRTDGQGDLDGNSLARTDAGRFGLKAPQGLTLDPQSGSLFVLDRGPRIVRLAPTGTGSFDTSNPTIIDLTALAGRTLRGIAFDPATQHLHVLSPADQQLYELTLAGQLVATRDLRGLGVRSTQAIMFAPTSDQTDAASRTSLFVADTNLADTSTGQIIELSFAAAPTGASPNFSATLVHTTDMAVLSPPSPDPSGITYLPGSNTLLISDGEVEETVNNITHFQGANMWELSLGGSIVRTSNISKVAPTSAPITNEPTGVAFKPSSGQYFVSEDDGTRIFTVNVGADQLLGTADDTWTSFSTLAAGNGDPEGIAYDSWNDRLFVSDGVNMEIYQYTLSGALVGQFDVEQYGVIDPESVEFNPDTGTLLVLSNHGSPIIVETSTGGTLLRTFDVSAASAFAPAGLAYAPASDGSGAKHFYIVDRAVDNNDDPAIVDGKLFELTAPPPISSGNQPPIVSAGPDMTVALPATGFLDATVTDDGLPNPPGAVTVQWSQVSGPSTVTFASPNAIDTAVTFNIAGTYVLRLSATDSEYGPQDDVSITVTGVGSILSQDVLVTAGSDDAEENAASNGISLTSTDLDLMYDSSATPPLTNLAIGLRFNGLNIPQNAQIVSAYLQFESDEVHPDATTLTIQGQAIDNAPTFTTLKRNISSRARTTAAVNWTPPGWTAVGMAGLAQRTPELAAIIQEIVSRPGWLSGNSLAMIITGSGQQVARSYEGSVTGAPMLHIEYLNGPVPTATPTATSTPTATPTATSTALPTATPTATSTALPTDTPTATSTALPTATPTATSTALPTATPTATSSPLPDAIFADDFEAGNLAAWSSVTNSTKLSVTNTAALAGSYGLEVLIDDNTGRYLTDNTPSAETRYRIRFRFDPNSIPMAKNDTHYIVMGLNASGTAVVRAELRRGPNGYQIQAGVADDATGFTNTGYFAISDAPHTIELDWRAATAVGANNGGVTLWIDGVQRSTITTSDNDTRRVESMRLGAVSGIDTGTRGSYYFDSVVSRRTTYIGP